MTQLEVFAHILNIITLNDQFFQCISCGDLLQSVLQLLLGKGINKTEAFQKYEYFWWTCKTPLPKCNKSVFWSLVANE